MEFSVADWLEGNWEAMSGGNWGIIKINDSRSHQSLLLESCPILVQCGKQNGISQDLKQSRIQPQQWVITKKACVCLFDH